MFRGITAVNLDAKGRISVPVRYRLQLEQASNQLIVTIDTEDPCLLLYLLPEWEALESKIEALPYLDQHARRVRRLLVGHATEVELDNSGRILLPPLLRKYAGLEKQLVLVGQGKKFEIWSTAVWEKARQHWLGAEPQADGEFSTALMNLSI